jgi:hypothetical protein
MTTMIYVIFACMTIGPLAGSPQGCHLYHPILSYDHKNAFASAEECKTEAARLPSEPYSERNVNFVCAGKPVSTWVPVQ